MFDFQVEKELYDKIATNQTYELVQSYINRLVSLKGARQVGTDVQRDENCETLDYLTHLIEVGALEVLRNCNLLKFSDLRIAIFHVSTIINFTIGAILNEMDARTCPGGFLFNPDSMKILMGRTYRTFLEHEVDDKLISGAVHIFLIEPLTKK